MSFITVSCNLNTDTLIEDMNCLINLEYDPLKDTLGYSHPNFEVLSPQRIHGKEYIWGDLQF